MDNTVTMPIPEAWEVLWYVNEYFGFKYPNAELATLCSALYRGNYLFTPSISQDRISALMVNILKPETGIPLLALHVLWLNANLNILLEPKELPDGAMLYPGKLSVERSQGQWTRRGNIQERLKLLLFLRNINYGDPVRITSGVKGEKQAVSLSNDGNWFIKGCWDVLGNIPNNDYAVEKITELAYIRKGSKDSDDILCNAFGVYRLLTDLGVINGEVSSKLLNFIWIYLQEMKYEAHDYDTDLTGNIETNIGNYRKRFDAGDKKANAHYPTIPEMNISLEKWKSLI